MAALHWAAPLPLIRMHPRQAVDTRTAPRLTKASLRTAKTTRPALGNTPVGCTEKRFKR